MDRLPLGPVIRIWDGKPQGWRRGFRLGARAGARALAGGGLAMGKIRGTGKIALMVDRVAEKGGGEHQRGWERGSGGGPPNRGRCGRGQARARVPLAEPVAVTWVLNSSPAWCTRKRG